MILENTHGQILIYIQKAFITKNTVANENVENKLNNVLPFFTMLYVIYRHYHCKTT